MGLSDGLTILRLCVTLYRGILYITSTQSEVLHARIRKPLQSSSACSCSIEISTSVALRARSSHHRRSRGRSEVAEANGGVLQALHDRKTAHPDRADF